jgi:hypothetical protein
MWMLIERCVLLPFWSPVHMIEFMRMKAKTYTGTCNMVE